MRDVLTGLAIAIITLLCLALVGPLLVDWTGQRARVESLLSETLGVRVSIGGAIDVRFLPTPRLVLNKALIGERPGPIVNVDRVAIEIATMPLLKGDIHILESRLSGARFVLTRAADGGFTMPQGIVTTASIEKLRIDDGRLQIRDAGGQAELDLAFSDVEADAGSLAGPWRVNGRIRVGAETRDMRMALSAPDGQGQRARLTLIDDDGARMDFDGRVSWERGTADGKATRQGKLNWPEPPNATRPYTITTNLALRGRQLKADPLDVELGEDVGALKLSGRAEWTIGQPLSVALESKSLDLDRPFKADHAASLSASATLVAWSRVVGDAVGDVPAMRIAFNFPQAILGGDALRAVTMNASVTDRSLRILDFASEAPGATTVTMRGDLAFGASPRFSGPVKIDSRDPARFAVWLEGEAGTTRFPLRADLKAEADLFVTRETIAASKLNFIYDRTQVTGAMRLQQAGERPKLEAQLASDRLALEALPDFSGLGSGFNDLDALISFEARQLDFGQEWRNGKMRVRLEKTGARIALPLFELTDQQGLSVRATGSLQGEGGRLDATLDLPSVAPLAQIARRFGGGVIAETVAARGSALSPFKGRVALFRDQGGLRVEANGRAATTDLASTVKFANDTVDGAFEIRAAEVTSLLKQAGLTVVLPMGRIAPARVTGALKGPASGPALQARFESGQTRLSVEGQRGAGGFAGQLRGESDDLTPWLQMLALPAPMVGERVPFSISANITDGTALAFEKIDARFGSQMLRGDLALQGDMISGALDADVLSFESLMGLSLGTVPPANAGATWPSARFTPPITPPFKTAIQLHAPSLALPFGWRGEKPRVDLKWSSEGLELADLQFGFAGGEWRGAINLKRQGGLASFASRTQWTNVDLATLLPQSGLTGRATMTLDLGAAGESVSAMIVALSGGGRLRIEDGGVAKLDTRQIMPVIAAADQGRDAPDQRALRELVTKALDSGPLNTDAFETTIAVGNGVARIGPAAITAAFTQGQALALYDLKTMKLDARLTMQTTNRADWVAPPQWSVQWRTLPNGALSREVDVATLVNLLTTRYVSRELQRLEAEEADLRERNFFIRRQRSEKTRYEERLRQEEINRAEDEAKRAREEAEKMMNNIMPPPVEPAQPSFN